MDEIFETVGACGKFQYKAVVLIGLISALSSACMYATIFIAAEPELKCVGHSLAQHNAASALNRHNQTNRTQLWSGEHMDADAHCRIWSLLNKDAAAGSDYHDIEQIRSEFTCHFDKTYYDKTIINDWGLICDKSYMASLTQTVHIFGSIFGFFGGILGDIYGRRRSVLFFFVLLTLTLIVSQTLMQDEVVQSVHVKYVIYSISQFLIGFLVNCLYCTAYVLLLEFTSERYRNFIANVNSYIYVLGEFFVLAVYYFFPDWHVLNWSIAIYSTVLLVVVYFYLEESPSWLISCDNHDAALVVLNRMAQANGKGKHTQVTRSLIDVIAQQEQLLGCDAEDNERLPVEPPQSPMLLISRDSDKSNHQRKLDETTECDVSRDAGSLHSVKTSDLNESDHLPALVINIKSSSKDNNDPSNHTANNINNINNSLMMFKQLFVPRSMMIKTLLLFYIWIALMLMYYGISLGVTNMEEINPYLMYFLSSLAEVIGVAFCYFNDLLGRRLIIICFFIITTIMYALIALSTELITLPTDDSGATLLLSFEAILLMVFALVGKCAVSGAYNIAYIYTSELYPTSSRNTALLFLICIGGTSSLVAPQINLLKTLVWNPLPYIIYSLCALSSCICVWFLPETKLST